MEPKEESSNITINNITPQPIQEFNLKINYKDKVFKLDVSKNDKNILLKISNIELFPPEIYEEELNLENLKKDNILFSLYNKIEDIIAFINFNLKENQYNLDINEKQATLCIKSGVIGIPEIKLVIKKKEIDEKKIIPLICDEMKKLKEKIEILEEKNNNIINNYNIMNNNINSSKYSLKIIKKYENYKDIIYGVNIFPNGNFIAYSGNNKNGSNLYIFSGEKKKNVYDISKSHEKAISYLEIIDDNNFITCSFDKKIIIWSINGIKPVKGDTLEGHSGKIFKVIFINPRIISCGENGEIIIWEKKDEKYTCAKKLNSLGKNVYNLLRINNDQFISSDDLGNLICWNLYKYVQVYSIQIAKSRWNNEIVKINDSTILFGGKCFIQIINLKKKKIEKSIKIKSIIFSIELLNNEYFICGDNHGKIEIREINTLNKITQKKFLPKINNNNKGKEEENKKNKIINKNEIIYKVKKINENNFIICSDLKRIFLIKFIKKQ